MAIKKSVDKVALTVATRIGKIYDTYLDYILQICSISDRRQESCSGFHEGRHKGSGTKGESGHCQETARDED